MQSLAYVINIMKLLPDCGLVLRIFIPIGLPFRPIAVFKDHEVLTSCRLSPLVIVIILVFLGGHTTLFKKAPACIVSNQIENWK